MEFLYSSICHPTLEELILENTKVLELDEWNPSGLTLLTFTSYCCFFNLHSDSGVDSAVSGCLAG